jgi:hypothetical protein
MLKTSFFQVPVTFIYIFWCSLNEWQTGKLLSTSSIGRWFGLWSLVYKDLHARTVDFCFVNQAFSLLSKLYNQKGPFIMIFVLYFSDSLLSHYTNTQRSVIPLFWFLFHIFIICCHATQIHERLSSLYLLLVLYSYVLFFAIILREHTRVYLPFIWILILYFDAFFFAVTIHKHTSLCLPFVMILVQ